MINFLLNKKWLSSLVFWASLCFSVSLVAGCKDSASTTNVQPSSPLSLSNNGQPVEVEQEQSEPTTSTSITAESTPMREFSDKQIEQMFNQGQPIAPFDPDRTAEQLSQCAKWQEPAAPDPMSEGWYRAATTLHAIAYKTQTEYEQMLILYEAAARRGHYRAMLNLSTLYSTGGNVRGYLRFTGEPEKARMWIHEGLSRGWVGALEWIASAYTNGGAGYRRDQKKGLAYMQLASDLGVPLAQYQLGQYYETQQEDRFKGAALFACSASQGTISAANDEWGIIMQITGNAQSALVSYQMAVMAGGKRGGEAAFSLSNAFVKGFHHVKADLKTQTDEMRSTAYRDLDAVLRGGYDSQGVKHAGNQFLRFPRLNEVLPLPPAEITEWKGIYSAMSEDDAAYYQNPPPAEYYIKQVIDAGYMVPQGYLKAPVAVEY